MMINQIIEETNRLGIEMVREGDRIRLWPRSRVSEQLVSQVRQCKAELLEMLGDRSTRPSVAVGDERLNRSGFKCPWCGSRELLDGARIGWWCLRCERLAWQYIASGVSRFDYTATVDYDADFRSSRQARREIRPISLANAIPGALPVSDGVESSVASCMDAGSS